MAKKRKVTIDDVERHQKNGRTDKQICNYLKISNASLAAYKANLTRQRFDGERPWVLFNF